MNMGYILTDNGAIVFEVHEGLHITRDFQEHVIPFHNGF
jgi:hypothetical protein